ncbi:MAG: ribosomal protein S18-alanine N-acetyltransferase [Candidatus Asgardarchaeia archaeon]
MVQEKINVLIDSIKVNEIPEIMEINRLCLPENYSYYYFHHLVSNWPDVCLDAKVNGNIVGYILCRVEKGFSVFGGIRWVTKGHIVSIAVLPQFRGKGIGTQLMKHAIKNLIEKYNVSEIYLEVRVSNPAQHLYERLKFRKVKVLKGYYSDGEDAYLMALRTDEALNL